LYAPENLCENDFHMTLCSRGFFGDLAGEKKIESLLNYAFLIMA